MYCRLHHSGVCPRQVFPLQRHSWVVWAGSLLSAWGNISKWKSARLGIIVITLHSSHFSHQMRRTRGYSQRDPGEKMSNIRLQVGGIIPSEWAVRRQHYLARISYTCQSGFTLSGRKHRYCQADGSWSPTELPDCSRKNISSPLSASLSSTVTLLQPWAARCQSTPVTGGSSSTPSPSTLWYHTSVTTATWS